MPVPGPSQCPEVRFAGGIFGLCGRTYRCTIESRGIATATCGFTPRVGALLHSETTDSSRIGVRRAEGLHMRSKFKRILAVIGLTGLLAVPAGAAWAERSGDDSLRERTSWTTPMSWAAARPTSRKPSRSSCKDHKYNLLRGHRGYVRKPDQARRLDRAGCDEKAMGGSECRSLPMATDEASTISPEFGSSTIKAQEGNIKRRTPSRPTSPAVRKTMPRLPSTPPQP